MSSPPEHNGRNGAEHNGAHLPDSAPVHPPPQDTTPVPPAQGHNGSTTRALSPQRSSPVAELSAQSEQGKGSPRLLVISAAALTIVLSVVMSLSIVPGQVEIKPGVPAAQDILSPAYLSFPSKVLTDKAREKATNDQANEVWVQDTAVVQGQKSTLVNALAVVQSVRTNSALDSSVVKQQRLANIPGVKLTSQQIDVLLNMPDDEYKHWQDSGVVLGFDAAMQDRRLASDSDVAATRRDLASLLVPSLNGEQKAAAIAFISPLLAVNMHMDLEQTRQRQQDAAANVKPVIQTVQKGEAILRQGELATPEAIEKMEEAGLLSRVLSPQSIVGTTGIVALLMILLHFYIYRYAPQVFRRQKQLLLVGLLLAFTVTIARFFLPGHSLLPYLLPVAAVSMLIAVLLSANLAVMVTFVMSILLGMTLSTALPLDLVLYYFVGGLTGILTLTKVERVSTFARAAFYIVAASFMTAVMLRVLGGGVLDGTAVWMLWLAAAVNGFIAASITYAAFSLLGSIFGITTPLHLMELAHPDQPLLRRLMHEAPGTYHHSLVVGNLAEHAAEMIGADSLLTRVSAYYHDIGKAEHPYYFIDNQSGRANVHNDLSPWESAKIIAQHVEDGVRLGQKNGLPRRVLDAIPQHHGTMLIKFFYYKALEQDPTADPAAFRYPGPKPQTKETAILMLADGVEATVRSMAQSGALDKIAAGNSDASESPNLYTDTSTLSDDAVAAVVHKTINERIEDGQLDECDLTVRDIARIQEAFVSMLRGIYHPRVAYPDKPKEIAVEVLTPVPQPKKQRVVGRRQRVTPKL